MKGLMFMESEELPTTPALEWWETDPESPGHLTYCTIGYCVPDRSCPELLNLRAVGSASEDVYTRPMFEVLPQ